MSVIVKGMEIPTQGWKCPLNGVGVCKLKSLSCGKYIPALCPLTELPEKHGRLIDDEALREAFGMDFSCERCKQDLRDCTYNQVFTRMDFCAWLDNMETIVEAEGE